MAIAAFTIFNAGVEKPLADWGLDDLQFSDNDLAPATVEFTAAGRAVDAAVVDLAGRPDEPARQHRRQRQRYEA